MKVSKRQSPRERLLAASDELFYRNGVHSTGIDAVIAKADVAKGSLYYIFGGKDELVAAYLRGRLETWRNSVEAAQAGADDADGKILAIFDALADYVSRPGYRGCPFHNAGPTVGHQGVPRLGSPDLPETGRRHRGSRPRGARRCADRALRRSAGHRRYDTAEAISTDHRQTHRGAHPGSRESLQPRLTDTRPSDPRYHETDCAAPSIRDATRVGFGEREAIWFALLGEGNRR
jgi:AcrR family transcriptional regulator